MPQLVQTDTGPFGLSGGTIITGATNQDADAYCFYPVETCTNLVVTFSNLQNSPITLSQVSAGVPLYGAITNVTMDDGTAILYSGSYMMYL
jgi:hypothetical protein